MTHPARPAAVMLPRLVMTEARPPLGGRGWLQARHGPHCSGSGPRRLVAVVAILDQAWGAPVHSGNRRVGQCAAPAVR